MALRLILWLLCLLCSAGGAWAQAVVPGGYLVVAGNQIQTGAGLNVRLACVNADNSLPADVTAMRAAGFNCLRYSWWDARLSGSVNTAGSLLAMDAMVTAAANANMRVVFVHRGNEGSSTDGCLKQQKNGLWYDLNGTAPYDQTNNTNGCGTAGTITYATFRTNWINIATRYNGNTTVIGFDLHHEPLVPAASWSANNVCANCGTDVSGMCGDVGTAINAANTGALIICEGPLNNGTTYLNGTALNAVAGTGFTVSDLTMAATSPVTGFPANKLVYSAHDYPCNVNASCPSSGAASITARNTAWGYLVTAGTAPVFIGELGCSCDGTNGNLTDDNNWATAITQYANGQVQTLGGSGGPTFTGTQVPMSTAWWDWGNQPANNPNGVLLAGGGFNAGQRGFWLTLLYVPPPQQLTTWNPNDKTSGIVLSGSNKIATVSATETDAVRSTTSFSTGKICEEVTATTISANWDVGLANASYILTNGNGLGSDANGIGFDPNFNLPSNSALGVFYLSVLSSAADSTGDANGAAVTMCEDFGASTFWVTSPRMRALGNTWNNSPTANPATNTGGLSMSGLACPCFITWQTGEAGSANLNTTGPFAVATPSGFTPWDAAPATGGHVLLINLGANDNQPRHANDNSARRQLASNGAP